MTYQGFKTLELQTSDTFSITTVPCVGDDSQDLISAVVDKQIIVYGLVIAAQGACLVNITEGINTLFSLYLSSYHVTQIELGNTPITLPVNTALVMSGIGDYQSVQITVIYKLIDG